jgi:hypothetical protein
MKARLIFSFVVAAFVVACAFAHANGARAAALSDPQVVITWKAIDSTAPANYQGKVLPAMNSQVVASVEVLSGGTLANLKSRTIYWYLDDNFIGGGVGKQNVTFTAPGFSEIMAIRANLPDYPGGSLINTAYVQVATPQAVIVAPYPNLSFSQSTVALQAVPYFFEASDLPKLLFQWNVNGQPVTTQENPQDLIVNVDASTPSDYSLSTNLVIQKSGDPLTSARASVTVTKN